MSSVIEVKRVSKTYGNGTDVLRNFSYKFDEGKFYAIMGRSGAGKSTLLNIIGTVDKPTHGEVLIEGNDVAKLGENAKAKIRMKKIGFVFQGFYLNPYLSALENVIIPMRINPEIESGKRAEKAKELLDKFGAKELVDSKPSQMSGGEQQRVAIARALANDPKIILADEPTGNLDEANEEIVFKCLKGLSEQGCTVIVVSHNEKVKEYADELLILER